MEMAKGTPRRVRYFDGQFLGVEDFQTEQDYHIAMARCHEIGPHSWGIVGGLELATETGTSSPGTCQLMVRPGYAIDGYGRELVVTTTRRLHIDAEGYSEQGIEKLAVWLLYHRQPEAAASPPGGATTATTELPKSRWNEAPQIELRPLRANGSDPARPYGVPEDRLDFRPENPFPDEDGDPKWPVYLGQVPTLHAGTGLYPAVMEGRRYAGLVGQTLASPGGEARIELGGRSPADDRRFAIYLEPRHPDDPAAASGVAPEPVVEITADGRLTTHAGATMAQGLSLAGGAIDFAGGGARTRVADDKAPAWRLYRAGDARTGGEELRIEMPPAAPAGATQAGAPPHEVAVGAWSADEQRFRECLSVYADGSVRVHGDLIVTGLINRPAPDGPAGPAEEAAQAAELAAVNSALAAQAARKQIDALLQEQGGMLKKITELLKKIFAAFGIGGAPGGRPGA